MTNLTLPQKSDIRDAVAPIAYRDAASGRRYLPDQVVRVFFMPSGPDNAPFKPYSASQVASYAQIGVDVAQINANFQSIRTEDRARLMANVFGAWQRYARISFVEVTDMAQADIRVGAAQFNGTAANIPSVSYGDRFGSDVYVNLGFYNPRTIDGSSIVDHFSPGRRETHDLMHEVGHAIGIQHPALPQDGGTLEARFNHMPFTVMTNFSPLTDGFGPTAPSIMDMVGLEAIYGLRTAINDGNTIHRLDSPRGALGRVGGDRTGKVIYDTGPGIDTLAAEYLHASGEIEVSARPAVIDLRPAHFSSIDMNWRVLLSPTPPPA